MPCRYALHRIRLSELKESAKPDSKIVKAVSRMLSGRVMDAGGVSVVDGVTLPLYIPLDWTQERRVVSECYHVKMPTHHLSLPDLPAEIIGEVRLVLELHETHTGTRCSIVLESNVVMDSDELSDSAASASLSDELSHELMNYILNGERTG